jgi:hypothetical protein
MLSSKWSPPYRNVVCINTRITHVHSLYLRRCPFCVCEHFVHLFLLFMSMGWDYVSELQSPIGLLVILHVIYEDSHGGMILTGKRKELGELTPSATIPGLCGERPTANRLSHGTTFSSSFWGSRSLDTSWVALQPRFILRKVNSIGWQNERLGAEVTTLLRM